MSNTKVEFNGNLYVIDRNVIQYKFRTKDINQNVTWYHLHSHGQLLQAWSHL